MLIQSKCFKTLQVTGLQSVLCGFVGLEEQGNIPTSITPAQLPISLQPGPLWRLLFEEKGAGVGLLKTTVKQLKYHHDDLH